MTTLQIFWYMLILLLASGFDKKTRKEFRHFFFETTSLRKLASKQFALNKQKKKVKIMILISFKHIFFCLKQPPFISTPAQHNNYDKGCNNSKHPVPPPTTRPTTSLDDGDVRFSVSPDRIAPRRKCVVVSKLIFWNGEALDSMPVLLKALILPSNVM